MAIQSTVAAFLTAFRTSLQARPGLSGVRVDLVPTADTTSRESIILVNGPIEGDQSRLAMNMRQDAYRIPGQIDAFGADPDSDIAFAAAITRAGAILDELIQELDDNKPQVGVTTLDALTTSIRYTPLIHGDGGWVCRCDFVIDYRAEVT
jgi:hypothetical protein